MKKGAEKAVMKNHLTPENPEKIKSCITRRYFIVDPCPNPISI